MPQQRRPAQSQEEANAAHRRKNRKPSDDYVDPNESKIGKGLSDLARSVDKKAEDQADAIEEPTPTPSETPTPSPTPPAKESPLAKASRLARERRERDKNK